MGCIRITKKVFSTSRNYLGKCSVERFAAWSTDELRKVAGKGWMRAIQDRDGWRSWGEAYVQQWTPID